MHKGKAYARKKNIKIIAIYEIFRKFLKYKFSLTPKKVHINKF